MGTVASVLDAHDVENGKKDLIQQWFDRMRELKTGKKFHDFMDAYTMSEYDPINELMISEELMLGVWNDPEGRFAIEIAAALLAPEAIVFIGAGLVEAGLSEAAVANVLRAGQILGGGVEAATEEGVSVLLEKAGIDVNKYNVKRVIDFYNTASKQYAIYKDARDWRGYYDKSYAPVEDKNGGTNPNEDLETNMRYHNAYMDCYMFGNCEELIALTGDYSDLPKQRSGPVYYVDSEEKTPFQGMDVEYQVVHDQRPDYHPDPEIVLTTMDETEIIQ
jgi:hypothetical protein